MTRRTVMIGLGSNVGDGVEAFRSAVDLLRDIAGCQVVGLSQVYETAPVGPAESRYRNAVVAVSTVLTLHELLNHCQEVERRAGRIRGTAWGDRPVDLDILLSADEVLLTPDLTVPHRLMHLRRFVLDPLCEVCPDASHPLFGQRVSELASHWKQPSLKVTLTSSAAEVALPDLIKRMGLNERVEVVSTDADLTLGFESADETRWPPVVDLRTWPLQPADAVEAALASVCDVPTPSALTPRQAAIWNELQDS